MEWSAFSDSLSSGSGSGDGNNISDELNLRSETPLDEQIHRMYSFICSIIMLTFCCVGSIGNIISILVFTRRSMRSSINVLLSGLSIVDLSVLIVSILVFVVPGLNSYGHFGQMKTLQILIVCGFYQAGMIAQTCSVWTFVLISFERFLAVCRPLDVHRFLTVGRAKWAQIFVLIFAIGYNFIRFWEYSLVFHTDDVRNGSLFSWPIGYRRSLRDRYEYFISYYTISYVLVHFAVPFPLITVLNVHIVRAISAAGRARYTLVQKNRSKGDQRQQRQTTRMIVVVTAVFAFCNALPIVLNLWELFQPTLFVDEREEHRTKRMIAYFMLDISNVLVVWNSSFNFIIYAIYCRQYRRICSRYCRNGCRQNNKRVIITDGDALVTVGDDYEQTGISKMSQYVRTRSRSQLL